MPGKIDVKMKSHNSDASYPITNLRFPPTFKAACDAHVIPEGTQMYLFGYLVRKTTKVTLSPGVTTQEERQNKMWEKLTSYPEVVNYLLQKYSTDELIAESDAGINQLR